MMAIVNKIWLILVGFAGYSIFLAYEEHETKKADMESRLPIIKNQYKKKVKEKKQIASYLKDIEEAKKKIDLVAQEVEKITRKLPDEINDAQNLALIKSYSDDLNIKNVFLSPLNEENRGFYFSKSYEFTGAGTFLQFLILLEKLSTSEVLLNVKNVEFNRSKQKQRGRFQIINAKVIVESYRYNPAFKEDRGVNVPQNPKKAPSKPKKGKKKS